MKTGYVMGIDNGTQSTKVVLFDMQGNEVATGSCKLQETVAPKEGYVLHPGEDLWNSVLVGIERCLQDFNGDRREIQAIGLCTIRSCRVLMKEDMSLAYPVMNWMDIRLAKPHEYVNDDVSFVTSTSGYLGNRLTGERKDTAGNYEFNWPLDFNTWDWSTDDKVLAASGVTREMLFDLVLPGEKIGLLKRNLSERFELSENIPVVATSNDKAVEVLGSGVFEDNTIVISLGTYISALLSKHKHFENAVNFFPTLAAIPYKYVYESQGIRRGMWTISWLKEVLGDRAVKEIEKIEDSSISVEDVLNMRAEEIKPGSEGLITILDWLSTPDKPYRKGMMIGFDNRHTKYHMYRSILEAIAYNIKNNIDDMLNETGDKIDRIVAIGGGSNSDVLMQIIADLFGLETHRRRTSSGAALGAAISAYKYLGIYDSFEEAAKKTVKTERVFSPDKENHKFYTEVNEKIIKSTRNFTDPLLQKMHELYK